MQLSLEQPDSVHLDLIRESQVRWRIEPIDGMRVPGIIFASERLIPDIHVDKSIEQVANVATLPGIVGASFAMPDIHWGYGFPIGGVAATDVEAGGVISPGGVGFDISCGVRLLLSPQTIEDLEPNFGVIMDALGRLIPRGLGRGAIWKDADLDEVMLGGVEYAVAEGFGDLQDLERCEDFLEGANPTKVGARARERGHLQVGSLGSGNHFLEVQEVAEVFDEEVAQIFGLKTGQVCVMIHCGSRGLGHQVCQDYIEVMEDAMFRYGIKVPDRQLACVPVLSREGQDYLGAMAAAANYGRVNRQVLSCAAREVFGKLELLYDVSHNLAQIETHFVDGSERKLCVHRKGATPARPPGAAGLPVDFAHVGQPVLVPGSMGTSSYVMVGTLPGDAFHSACHGAGRTMSRAQAKRRVRGGELKKNLEAAGISVRSSSERGLAEEAPFAYKDVDEVVTTCQLAGLARRVARLRPLGVVKG